MLKNLAILQFQQNPISFLKSIITQTVGLFLKWLFRYVATIRFGSNLQQNDKQSAHVNHGHVHVRENIGC
jgi:hypothetical protein